MRYIQESIAKFKTLPKEIQEAVGNTEALLKIKQLEQKYKIELGFLVILITIGELMMEDIEEYLAKRFKLAVDKAKTINTDLQKEVFQPALQKLGVNSASVGAPTKRPTLNEEKRMYLDVLKKELIPTFGSENKLQEAINIRIFYVLSKKLEFQEDLAKALQSNQEKLTQKKFELDSKPVRPTVANWLKDFIQHSGAGMFDNVKLSSYLTNSKNAKLLDEGEKKLVKKILLLYRNLTFFPESMPNDTGENWEIIPTEKEEVFTKVKAKMKKGLPKNSQAVKYEDSKDKEEALKKIEKKIKSQNMKGEIESEDLPRLAEQGRGEEVESDELKELQEMAEQYEEGSLERRAVEEEIRKISNF